MGRVGAWDFKVCMAGGEDPGTADLQIGIRANPL